MPILTDMEVMCDNIDYFEYYDPAIKRILGTSLIEVPISQRHLLAERMDDILGVSIARAYANRPTSQDQSMPDDWREFLTKLAGPHGKTILKVFQLRRENALQNRTLLQAAG